MFDYPAFVYHLRYLERAAPDEASRSRLAKAIERGHDYSAAEVADYALGEAANVSTAAIGD